MMENGMIPSSQVIEQLTSESQRYEYLRYIAGNSEIESYIKKESYTLAEYK